jgi:hypothetical protein
MEPSDPEASPWDRRVGPCVIHGWPCPNRVAPAQGPSSSSNQGEEEGREGADECRITVVTGPFGAPTIRRTACITIGPRGQTQGPLAPRTEPSPPPSPTLVVPPPTLPSTAGPVESMQQTGALTVRPLCRPIEIRSTTRHVESMRQPSAPAIHPLCFPI